MAGRGRGGRGRGRGMSFNIESLGFGRGEALPGPILQPPPLFLPLEFQPVPLNDGDECDYLLALKQEFRGTMRESPYFLKRQEKKKDIGRYSDKYQLGQQENQNWEPDWNRIPLELKIKTRTRRRNMIKSQKNKPDPRKNLENAKEIVKTLEELAKKEANENSEEEEEEEKKEEKENEDEENEEIYEEEELEEDTDYNLNYFDNGESYGADEDDDLDEGPIY